MNTFKDNDTLKELCFENKWEIVILSHNLTNKSQPLDISVNNAAEVFKKSQYNDWFSNKVSGIEPADIKITSKLSNLKPLQAYWIVGLYKHLSDIQEIIVNGFDSAGISEAVTKACTILDKVKSPFREM